MKPGDLVFCHTSTLIGKGIRFAQRRDGEKDWKENHVGVLYKPYGDDWYIIQAESKGVTRDKLLSQIKGTYRVVQLPTGVNPSRFLAFLLSQVGEEYSWTAILSCAVDMFTPSKLCFRSENTWICSALVAGALWYCGFRWVEKVPDLYQVTPAMLARACKF